MAEFLKFMTKKEKEKPEIFRETIYRAPTKEELIDVDKYNLSAKNIVSGLYYTMVGRGFLGQQQKDRIFGAVIDLIELFPTNKEYKKALDEISKLKLHGEK
jgi:hypothetical protein